MLRKTGTAVLLIIGYALLVVVGGWVLFIPCELAPSSVFVWIWAAWPFVVSIVLGWWSGSLIGGALPAAIIGLVVGCLNAIAGTYLGLPSHPAVVIIFIIPMGAGAVIGQRLQARLSPSSDGADGAGEADEGAEKSAGQ